MTTPRSRRATVVGLALAGILTACTGQPSDTTPTGEVSRTPQTAAPPTLLTADETSGTIGAPGIGDPYYPTSGNSGYQIDSYDLNVSYDPADNDLRSTAHLRGRVLAGAGLTQFNLDLQPTMEVTAVSVNGAAAGFRHDAAELVVEPAELLPPQARMTVEVTYHGHPDVVHGQQGGAPDGGWYRTDAGGAFAAGEPISASAWYPVNEHPADRAAFAVTATVPDGWNVIANGRQVTDNLPDPEPGSAVFRWELSQPVASYLTTIYIDHFTFERDELPDGTPMVTAVGPDVDDGTDRSAQTADIIEILTDYFGPYPAEAAGGIFIGSADTGIDLETATRPIYAGEDTDIETMVHEISHEWFGNHVAIQRWSDICLNECLASYATWIWRAETDDIDLDSRWQRRMERVVEDNDFWATPLVDMGPGREFTTVYDRGPLALHALRNEIGDNAFFTLLEQWPAAQGGTNVSFEDFEAMIDNLSGKDMGPFMDAWFRGTQVPSSQFRYPGDLAE